MARLTVFTTCKPFEGQTAVHQRNALESWRRADYHVLVFGEEGAGCDIPGVASFSNVPTDEYGLPVLSFMFSVAQLLTGGDLLCYANADLLLPAGLDRLGGRVCARFPDGFLGVCRRRDVDLDGPLDSWPDHLVEGAELYTPCSSDIFLFKRPLRWQLPPFTAGRPKWDNWMLWAACEYEVPVVDLSDAYIVLHPRHGYGPDGCTPQKQWRGHESGARNEKLAAGKVYCLKHVQAAGFLWTVTEEGEIVKRD